MAKNRISMKDIAKELNITVNSVSRAIQDKSDISLKLKEEVRETALRLGYIPNTIAKSLRTGKSNTIGVVFDNLSNPYFMIVADMINKELSKRGYSMTIFTSLSSNASLDLETINHIVSKRCDGIISFLRPSIDGNELIKRNLIPTIIIGREADDLNIDSVFTNDVNGGYLIAKHFFELGLKNVAYIGAPKEILCSVKRAKGFINFYEEKGIILDESKIVFTEFNQESVVKTIIKTVESGVEGIFCFNDSTAFLVIDYIQRTKKQNICVAGYDNICKALNIPLSFPSIDTDKECLVINTIDTLISRIKREALPLVTIVQNVKIII